MTRALSTLTAATAGVGIALASTSAKAFVPLVLGAIIGGSVLGGAVLGTAATHPAYPYYATAAPVAVTPGVTVNSTSCYFTDRLVNPVNQTWVRERICTTAMP